MFRVILDLFDNAPRRVFTLLSLACFVMLSFGLYLQHSLGLEPCPMCIVQRYALLFVAVIAGLMGASEKKLIYLSGSMGLFLVSLFGAFVAARQSWLQWYPPQVATCGRDFYGMIEAFPISRVIPMIFKGSGDCSAIDWTFLGGSIANWSFVFFTLFAGLALIMIWRHLVRR
jgi:disulfide bond formation protein DsbB